MCLYHLGLQLNLLQNQQCEDLDVLNLSDYIYVERHQEVLTFNQFDLNPCNFVLSAQILSRYLIIMKVDVNTDIPR